MAQSNEQGGDMTYGEFAEFLEASRNGEPAMIKATNMNVTLYNQQAVDELLIIDRKQHELETLHEIIAENTDTINGTIDADGIFESVIEKIESLKEES